MATDKNLPIEQLARELVEAEDQAKTILPFHERIAGYTTEDGYLIQEAATKLKLARGATMVGKKIGFTSERLRRQFGVNEPDYGILFDDNMVMEHEPLEMDRLIAPRVEAEIAFILKADLDKPVTTAADVVCATEGIMPAIEIVDSRFDDWRVTVPDTIADNAACAKVILGGVMRPLVDFDLRYIGMTIYKNGQLIDSATGANVFGNPVHAVAWLANRMYKLGTPLKKGDIVMSGSFTAVFPIQSGDYVEAIFDRLGKVSLTCR